MFRKLTNSIIVVLWINIALVYAEDNPTVNEDKANTSIKIPASPVKFPLFKEDKKDIDALIKKFEHKRKREIVFSISSESPLKKWQLDLTETNPSSIHIPNTPCIPNAPCIPNIPCINPTCNYNRNSIGIPRDNEYFYIQKDVNGPVRRYKKTLRQKIELKSTCIYH